MVDGARLLLTPLQHELVPPPMASVVAACPAPVQSVSFRSTADQHEVGILYCTALIYSLASPACTNFALHCCKVGSSGCREVDNWSTREHTFIPA